MLVRRCLGLVLKHHRNIDLTIDHYISALVKFVASPPSKFGDDQLKSSRFMFVSLNFPERWVVVRNIFGASSSSHLFHETNIFLSCHRRSST